MFKKLEAFLIRIFRTELEAIEKRADAAALATEAAFKSGLQDITKKYELRFDTAMNGLRAHVSAEVAVALAKMRADIDALGKGMSAENGLLGEHITAETNRAAGGALFALKAHVTEEVGNLTAHTTTAVKFVKNSADEGFADMQKGVAVSVAEAKEFMQTELWKKYETLVRDAAGAARIVDSSKIAMAVCDVCHAVTRRFAVSRINGDVNCSTCVAAGKK
jgi:hypothetical protein